MNSLELDFVFSNRAAELAAIEKAGLRYEIVTECGPGGGCPVLKLTGENAQIRAYLSETYCDGLDIGDNEEDVEFFMSLVQ